MHVHVYACTCVRMRPPRPPQRWRLRRPLVRRPDCHQVRRQVGCSLQLTYAYNYGTNTGLLPKDVVIDNAYVAEEHGLAKCHEASNMSVRCGTRCRFRAQDRAVVTWFGSKAAPRNTKTSCARWIGRAHHWTSRDKHAHKCKHLSDEHCADTGQPAFTSAEFGVNLRILPAISSSPSAIHKVRELCFEGFRQFAAPVRARIRTNDIKVMQCCIDSPVAPLCFELTFEQPT